MTLYKKATLQIPMCEFRIIFRPNSCSNLSKPLLAVAINEKYSDFKVVNCPATENLIPISLHFAS